MSSIGHTASYQGKGKVKVKSPVAKPLRRSGMDHTVLPANYTTPAFNS